MARLTGLTTLIVEDENLIALDMMTTLQSEDAHVIAPRSALEAFEVAAYARISAAILDVNLGQQWRLCAHLSNVAAEACALHLPHRLS